MCYSMSNLSRLSDALFLFRSSTVVCLHLISEDKMLQLFLVPKEEFFSSFPLFCLINLIISRCSNHHNNFIPITSLSQSHHYPNHIIIPVYFSWFPPPPVFPSLGEIGKSYLFRPLNYGLWKWGWKGVGVRGLPPRALVGVPWKALLGFYETFFFLEIMANRKTLCKAVLHRRSRDLFSSSGTGF